MPSTTPPSFAGGRSRFDPTVAQTVPWGKSIRCGGNGACYRFAAFDKTPSVFTLSDDEAALVVKVLEHYDAYLMAAKREVRAYRELAERLKRKPPEQEVSQTKEKRKKA